jgi:SAM-dependent methyltransferase
MTAAAGHGSDEKATWDRMARIYTRELDPRFAPIVDLVVTVADCGAGASVIDVGTGTGSVALSASRVVGPTGRVLAVDISPRMLTVARERANTAGASNVRFREGGASSLPAPDSSADALMTSLCMMFVPDRARAAMEFARVLRPGGRFVAAVWGPPERCDIVRLQQIVALAGGSSMRPEVSPVSLADPGLFLEQLRASGIESSARRERVSFSHDNLQQAFEIASIVTQMTLTADAQIRVKQQIAEAMWPEPDAPRELHNEVVLITGRRT